MRKKLLNTIGYDSEGHLTFVEETKKGETYTCPQCGGRIIAHNSGKTGKGVKRPHFAHVRKAACSGESVLRHLFRQQIVRLLTNCLDEHLPFPIQWNCPYCSKRYDKNLLQQARTLAESYTMEGGHTPDITLLDEEGRPLIGIEIVLRRRPSKRIVEQYEAAGIILIQIRPDAHEVRDVASRLHKPDSVAFCSNDECYNSQFCQHTIRRSIFHQPLKCKTCSRMVDGYLVRTHSAFGPIKIDNLTDDEKQEILSKHFRGKKATVADFLVYGKCKCVPYSKGLQYIKKADNAYMQGSHQGKVTKRK